MFPRFPTFLSSFPLSFPAHRPISPLLAVFWFSFPLEPNSINCELASPASRPRYYGPQIVRNYRWFSSKDHLKKKKTPIESHSQRLIHGNVFVEKLPSKELPSMYINRVKIVRSSANVSVAFYFGAQEKKTNATVFSRVLRDSTPRYVSPLVGRSIGWLVGRPPLYFFGVF